jgi:hypothetical protein
VSVVWIALLALAVAVLIAAEWPRLESRFGDARPRRRKRNRRGPKLRVVTSDDEQDDFAASVERDLSLLPTIDEDERRGRRR